MGDACGVGDVSTVAPDSAGRKGMSAVRWIGPVLLDWACTIATGQASAQWQFLSFSFLEKI
jgi:hypothetical protein